MIGPETVAYVDSSVLLAVLLSQPRSLEAARLWAAHRRVSSVLLAAECRTVLRRAARAGVLADLAGAERDLDTSLAQLPLHVVDSAVLERLAATPQLGACRTLDALHLATALTLRDRLGRGLVVATFDQGMAEVGRDLGLPVVGAAA